MSDRTVKITRTLKLEMVVPYEAYQGLTDAEIISLENLQEQKDAALETLLDGTAEVISDEIKVEFNETLTAEDL